jgi:hypothetical protein
MDAPLPAACAVCGKPLLMGDPRPVLRSGEAHYHLTCAPSAVIEGAAEEYEAILRKGVRYFVEKYTEPTDSASDMGSRFLGLGRAIEVERSRRSNKAGTRSSE